MVAGDFVDLGLDSWVQTKCAAMKFLSPTEVQKNVIPPILSGKDIIAISKTGSGKTASFALPILNKLSEDMRPFFAVVITPTRELAMQIKHQFDAFGHSINATSVNIIGGVDVLDQIFSLKEAPNIIISTPGRLASFISTKSDLDFSMIKYFVIDEADRIFDDGFGDDMEVILNFLPKTRQTLLFTATINQTIEEMIEKRSNNCFVWHQESKVATVDSLDQFVCFCPAYAKEVYLIHLIDDYLDNNKGGSIMIFSNSCKFVQLIGYICDKMNIRNVTLHSKMQQRERTRALNKFKSSIERVLISTDVASRGLDIPTVDLVINHNVPFKPKNYVHRVGRTARAGKTGKAITLVTPFDISRIQNIENVIKMKLKVLKPSEKKINEIYTEVAMAKRQSERQIEEFDYRVTDRSELEEEKKKQRQKIQKVKRMHQKLKN